MQIVLGGKTKELVGSQYHFFSNSICGYFLLKPPFHKLMEDRKTTFKDLCFSYKCIINTQQFEKATRSDTFGDPTVPIF